jgi:hypothetical protein
MFKCEHCFKKCEYTDSQRMIHAAVGPELQKKKILLKSKVHLYYDIHITEVNITQYTSDHMNNRNTWIIQVSGVT